MIEYKGSISSSKSLVNRALLVEKAFEGFNAIWSSKASDVLLLEEALKNLNSKEFYVGEGGTTFRFLSVFLSSFKGEYRIKAKKSLLKRPHDDLFDFLKSQGVTYEVSEESFYFESKGWSFEAELEVSSLKTTQVATAVLLTALRFKNPFKLKFKNVLESDYFLMTEKFLEQLGIVLEKTEASIEIKEINDLKLQSYSAEGDWSSAAFLFVLGALKGSVEIENLKTESIQPDVRILEILKGSSVDVVGFRVKSRKEGALYKAQTLDLQGCPDLFPVLAAFFVFCEGETKLFGASQLVYKESNRIDEVYRLLSLCGYEVQKLVDGVSLKGMGSVVLAHDEFDFDCSEDHRVYMCAYILKFMGYKINIIGESAIQKSFPEFLDLKEKYVFSDRT